MRYYGGITGEMRCDAMVNPPLIWRVINDASSRQTTAIRNGTCKHTAVGTYCVTFARGGRRVRALLRDACACVTVPERLDPASLRASNVRDMHLTHTVGVPND